MYATTSSIPGPNPALHCLCAGFFFAHGESLGMRLCYCMNTGDVQVTYNKLPEKSHDHKLHSLFYINFCYHMHYMCSLHSEYYIEYITLWMRFVISPVWYLDMHCSNTKFWIVLSSACQKYQAGKHMTLYTGLTWCLWSTWSGWRWRCWSGRVHCSDCARGKKQATVMTEQPCMFKWVVVHLISGYHAQWYHLTT